MNEVNPVERPVRWHVERRHNRMNKVYFGDCRDTMRDLKAQGVRVQCCVTSPPYFGLRSYMPDAVKLRGDINPEELASVLKELERLGVSPCSHTSE